MNDRRTPITSEQTYVHHDHVTDNSYSPITAPSTSVAGSAVTEATVILHGYGTKDNLKMPNNYIVNVLLNTSCDVNKPAIYDQSCEMGHMSRKKIMISNALIQVSQVFSANRYYHNDYHPPNVVRVTAHLF